MLPPDALSFCGVSRNGLDRRTALAIRGVLLVAAQSWRGTYVELAAALVALECAEEAVN